MISYILEQPDIILKIVDKSYKIPIDINDRNIIITASGSSLNAGILAIDILDLNKVEYQVMDPYTLRYKTDYLKDKGNVIIGLSQTGRSTSTLECLDIASQNGLDTISLTSGLQNPLADIAKYKFDILCGDEPIGPKTKGLLATTLALIKTLTENRNIDSLNYDIIIKESKYIKQVVDNTVEWCNLNPQWSTTNCLSMLGFGIDDSLCKEGALKILETLQIPIMNYPAEEFMHGPHRTIKPKGKIIVLNTVEETNTMMSNFVSFSREKGAEVLYLTPFENDGESIQLITNCPWLEILVILQTISAYLPTQVGIDPATPVYPEFASTVGTRV